MIRLSSAVDVIASISHARSVGVLAYTLRHGPVFDALEAAAGRGARVKVCIEGATYGDANGALGLHNRRMVDELRRFGVDARLAHAGGADTREPPVHAKALVADDCLYLDDRNWGADDLIVTDDDARAVRAVTEAVDGNVRFDASSSAFTIQKRSALAREAELLRGARIGDNVIVETESFGYDNPVYDALDGLGKRGITPRLLVCGREMKTNEREKAALTRLARDGVAVRVTASTEKFALAGARAWIGSANASPAFGHPDIIDWGACTTDAATVAAARERVEAHWTSAKSFSCQGTLRARA
jgi:hypothetical protein